MSKKTFKPSVKLNESDVTDEAVFNDRRQLLKKLGYAGAGALLGHSLSRQRSVFGFV